MNDDCNENVLWYTGTGDGGVFGYRLHTSTLQDPTRWPSMEHQPSGSEEAKANVLDILDIESHAKTKGTAAPPAKQYAFRVDKDRVVVDEPLITGREILAKVGKTPE